MSDPLTSCTEPYYGYHGTTATLCHDTNWPYDAEESSIRQIYEKDDFKVMLSMEHLTEQQVKALMILVNALGIKLL